MAEPLSPESVPATDPELLSLIPTFLKARRKDLRALGEALARRDFGAIAAIGHKIKGDGGFGFRRIVELGLAIERSAQAGAATEVEAQLAELAACLDQADAGITAKEGAGAEGETESQEAGLLPLTALVVEDDEPMREVLATVLRARGHAVTACADAESALVAYQAQGHRLVFLDWGLPGMDGLQLCRALRGSPRGDQSVIVMITGRDHERDLHEVLRAGANDYLSKPVTTKHLRVRIAIAEQAVRNLDHRRHAEEALHKSEATLRELTRRLEEKEQFLGFVGNSQPIVKIHRQIQDLAKVDTTVLIEGETGTGKELVARAIHHYSARRSQPFIAVNCAGLTDSLLGSQLFGHRKGAFTGAVDHHRGLFEAADGGTIFLDEIGGIPDAVQTALLRVLQEREILRLGESSPRKINVRILAATHHNLSRDVLDGTFRADLLYRIRVARIQLPPLRERRSDIPLLASAFLEECSRTLAKPVENISGEAMNALISHTWPGNVRELRGAIESAVVTCPGTVIQFDDLPAEIRSGSSFAASESTEDEKARILSALQRAKGNRTEAARLLGMSRATFYRRLTDLSLLPERSS